MDIDLKKYRDLFFQESREYLELFFSHLSRMDGTHFDNAAIDELFRAAHSIKGMAASVEFDDVARLSHALESLLDRLRRKSKTTRKKDLTQIYEYVKALESLIEKHSGKEVGDIDVDGLIKQIELNHNPGSISELSDKAGRVETKEERGKINIVIVIDPTVESPSIRAYMALRKLKEFGEILSSSPSVNELRSGRFNGTLTSVFSPVEDINKITQELKRVHGVIDVTTNKIKDEHREPKRKSAERIKIKEETLDTILSITGELIMVESRILESLKKALTQKEEGYFENLSHLITRMKETVLSARLLPLSFLTDRLPRVVLDAAQKTGKEVELIVHGEEVEIDRFVLDSLHDPLTHILRNSVDHGIELPEERERKGKRRAGKIEINARRTGEFVEINIADDGRGMDAEALKEKALSMGFITEEQAMSMSYNDALYLSCLPGLSTRASVTATSGRGVGLDVVKSILEAHGGILLISSVLGTKTEIILKLPLNLSVVRTLILRTGDEQFGIPLSRVEKVIEINKESYALDDNLYEFGGEMIKVLFSRRFFGQEISEPGIGVLITVKGKSLIIGVDTIVNLEDLYIMPVPKPLNYIKGMSGVTILGNGKPIFILDPYYLGEKLFNELH